jgi:hypothetical protein
VKTGVSFTYFKNITNSQKEKEKKWNGLSTTTTGKRNDGKPPGGMLKSLLGKSYLPPPFARYCLPILELLELAMLPFPIALEGSTFISEIFFTFFSWTCTILIKKYKKNKWA